MTQLEPNNQLKIFGLNIFISELIELYENNKFPNKLLLSGQKGIGKSTLAYHFINYVLSKDEDYKYNIDDFEINPNNHSFKTVLNKSNANLIVIDINIEKKSIDINQIRELISKLHKSSFNNKPRFVLIDNIEYLNTNSINALLKILEEPNFNVHFILINNNKKILPTLLSRCINFRISLTNKLSLDIANLLLDNKLYETINTDLINYYITPGTIYNLAKFGRVNKCDLIDLDLKNFLRVIIEQNFYKKDYLIKYLVYDLMEFYFRKINFSFSTQVHKRYNYFVKRISDSRNFNLDEESVFVEFNEEILNG